ncbi:transposase [Streptomyces sp. NPDC047980]|uniref:transposase n=1 Tax=Streptomyces sp. NPDC047980 TaxID=3365494 RepID=UPI00371C2968
MLEQLPEGRVAPAARPPAGRRPRPCTVVLDNASAHVSRLVNSARPVLQDHGVTLFYLPPYSPERIERRGGR